MRKDTIMDMNRKWRDWRLNEAEELQESSYIVGELEATESGHDWKYKMGLKVSGTSGASKNLAITQKQFNAIKKILSK